MQPFVKLAQWAVSVTFLCDLLRFHCNFFLFDTSNSLFFSDVLHKENYSLSISKFINFDAVDFSECRSKEVISFFWCSVYCMNEVKDNMEYLQHDYMLIWTASDPLSLHLSCDKGSCDTEKEWNALIWQICYKESTCCQSTATERHICGTVLTVQ